MIILAVAIHDTDNIITEENIEECVVDYWTQRVKDFSDVREHELNSDMGKEWLEEIISNISMYTAYDKKKWYVFWSGCHRKQQDKGA